MGQPRAFCGWRLGALRSTAQTGKANFTPAHTASCPHSGGIWEGVQEGILIPCSCGFLASNFSEDIVSLPSVPTSCRRQARPVCQLLLHPLLGFPNSSLVPDRRLPLTCIVVHDSYPHPCHSWPQDRRNYPFMWGQICGQTKAWLSQWSRAGLKVPPALSGHLGKAQPAPHRQHLYWCYSWLWHGHPVKNHPDSWVCIQLPVKRHSWNRGVRRAGACRMCLKLLQSFYIWLSEMSVLCWKSAPGPLRAMAACDRKIVKNRPESLPGLPMNVV